MLKIFIVLPTENCRLTQSPNLEVSAPILLLPESVEETSRHKLSLLIWTIKLALIFLWNRLDLFLTKNTHKKRFSIF